MSEAAPTTITAGSSGSTVQPDLSSTGGPSGVQGSGAGPVSVPANAPTDWTSTLPEAQRMYVQNKGFKDAAAVLDSYKSLETLMGTPKERLLRLPDKPDAPEWGEVYERLGRPKNADEYKFATPQGVEANKEFTSWAQKQFHELGLTRAQGETLAQRWNEYASGDSQKLAAEKVTQIKTEETALKREWGAAYEQQTKTAFKAAQTFGLGQAEVTKLESALGYSATMKFLASVGSKLGEDSFITGEQSGGFNGALTPERALAEIEELKKDKEFVRKYNAGDRDSFKKMTRLHQFAHPELPQD